MNSANLQFNIRLLFLTLALYAVYFFLAYSYTAVFVNSFGEAQIVYFAIISSLGFFFLESFSRKNPKEFVLAFLVVLTVKFLSILTGIIIYFKVYEKLTIGFSAILLSLFLIYTVFELIFYLKWFKN